MTDATKEEILKLHAKGYSNCFISACVDNATYYEIEDLLGAPKPGPDQMSPALRAWWLQQPWVWRPDNTEPIEAPWERVSREWY
jgi:hypothetical protein